MQKKGDSHAEKEICLLCLTDFNAGFAWWVGDMVRRKSYRFFPFHKKGEFMVTVGGDTGGWHFKFVMILTHKDNDNSGKDVKVLLLSDTFKESTKNLERILSPTVGKILMI